MELDRGTYSEGAVRFKGNVFKSRFLRYTFPSLVSPSHFFSLSSSPSFYLSPSPSFFLSPSPSPSISLSPSFSFSLSFSLSCGFCLDWGWPIVIF